MEYIQYIIIIIITFIVALAIIRSKKKDFKLESNKLIRALGGKDNIVHYEVSQSRFIVKVKDVDIVSKEEIQKMGAKGIVEIENELKIILGDSAMAIKKYIDTLK